MRHRFSAALVDCCSARCCSAWPSAPGNFSYYRSLTAVVSGERDTGAGTDVHFTDTSIQGRRNKSEDAADIADPCCLADSRPQAWTSRKSSPRGRPQANPLWSMSQDHDCRRPKEGDPAKPTTHCVFYWLCVSGVAIRPWHGALNTLTLHVRAGGVSYL